MDGTINVVPPGSKTSNTSEICLVEEESSKGFEVIYSKFNLKSDCDGMSQPSIKVLNF